MKRKSFIFLGVGLLFTFGGALIACNQDAPEQPTSSESRHQHKATGDWIQDSEGHYHKCEGCDEKLDYAAHTYEARTTTVTSSCTTPGYDQEETYCTVCGYVQSTTKKNIVDIAQHDYEEVERVDATCTTAGYIEYKCKNCDDTYRETINALGHDWVEGVDCDSFITCKNCDSTKPGPGHDYHVKSSVTATCTTDGEVTYECHECAHTYKVVTKAEGHKLTGELEFERYEPVAGKECTYKAVYSAECSECGQEVHVEGEDELVRHTLITKYKTYPTCSSKGLKGNYCTTCNKYIGNMIEVAINPDAHNWELQDEEGGIKTYQCTDCHKTKTVIETTEEKLEAKASDVKDNEIAIQDVALKFEGVESESENLFVEVVANDPDDIPNLSDEDLERINGNNVYDFTIYDYDAEDDVTFGKVTVRIPYELQEGDDVDALVVYFINSDGELEAIDAKYVDGYAVFETEHFSFYCVTFMSPAERCAKYGHNWSEEYSVNGGCISDSFSYHYCHRCHGMEYTSYTKAPGHKYVANEEGSKEATCTKSGHTDYLCSVCGDHYGTDVPALGHKYELDKDHSAEPNCTEGGTYAYICHQCGESEPGHSYTLTTAALGHQHEAQVTPATCEAEGSIKYVCKVCGEEDTSRATIIEKLDHKYEYDSETDSQYIYKCEVCGATLEVAKSGTKSLNKDYAVENSFFTSAAASVVGEEIASNGEFVLEINDNGKVYKYSYEDAEAYVGLDANGMVVAYGKVRINNGSDSSNLCAFYLKDNMLYTAIDERYYAINLSNTYINGYGDITTYDIVKNIPNIIDFMKNEVKDYVDGIMEVKGDEINETIFTVLDSLFDFETSVNGFNIKFSSAKFSNFVKTMKEGSLREIIEFVIGKDKVNEVLDRISEYSDVSYMKALEMFKEDTGIDYKELLALVDKGVAKFTEYESLKDMIQQLYDVDIDEYLADAYLESHTLVKLVKENSFFARFFSNKTIAEFIEDYIKVYLDKTLEEIIDNENAYKNFTDVLDIVEDVAKHAGLTLRFKEDGSFLGVDMKVNATEKVNDDRSFTAKGNLTINFGSTLNKTYDYQNLKNLTDRIIKAANHDGGLDKDLVDSFDTSYKLTKTESGLITRIEHENKYNDYYYSPEPDHDGYVYGTITNKSEALKYIENSYYPDIVDLINEYGLDDYYIQVKNNGYSYKYYTPSINVAYIAFNRTCGNSFDVNLSYGTMCEYTGSSISLIVYGDSTDPVKTVTTTSNKNSYHSSESVYFTYNTANGKINAPNSGHEWLLNESMSHYQDVKCGDYEEYVYNCVNCGASKTELRYVDHEDVEVTKAEFVNKDLEKNSCYNGVNVTYVCHDCEEEFVKKSYDHVMVNKQEVDLSENLRIDAKLIISTCLCGDRTEYSIPGFKRIDTYSYINGRYYHYIFESNELKDGQPTYIGLYTERESSGQCKYKTILNIVSNIYQSEELRLTKRVALGEFEDHYYNSYSLDALTPVDENNLLLGFDVKRTCINCGKKITQHYGPYDYVNFNPALDAAHTPYGNYNLHISGRAIDVYRGYVDDVYLDFYYCDFDASTLSDGTELYVCRRTNYSYGSYNSSEEPTKCPFNYYVKRNQTEHDSVLCRDVTYTAYGIGCDEKGKDPLYVFKDIRNTKSSHIINDEDKDLKTKTYADLDVIVALETGKCKDCGRDVSNLILTRDDPFIYTESKTETKNNVTTYYPAGYSPMTDTVEYDPNSYYYDEYGDNAVIITTKTTRTVVSRYFVADDLNNVRLIERKTVYDLNGSEIERYRSEKHYRAGEGLIYSYTSEDKKHSPHLDETTFKAKFKEYTLFDYSKKEFGCLSFWEEKETYDFGDGDVHEYTKVSDFSFGDHAATTFHDGTCSQPSYRTCNYCGKVVDVSRRISGHDFDWDSDKHMYVCSVCGTCSDSGYNGSVVMEDCSSSLDKTGKNLVIGYFFNDNYHYDNEAWDYTDEGYEVRVTLNGNNYYYSDSIVLDIDATTMGDGVINHYFKINKADLRKAVEKAIEENGYYYNYISVSLVPENYRYSEYNLFFTLDELGMGDLLPIDDQYRYRPYAGMAVIINGEYYLPLENEGEWADDPTFIQYSFKEGVPLRKGDVITFYNADSGDIWGTMTVDQYSKGSLTQGDEGILVGYSGFYDIYLKMKYGSDNIYVGDHQ